VSFKFPINRSVRNKTSNYKALTENYEICEGELQDLANLISEGYATANAYFYPGSDRNKGNVQGSNLIFLDVDNSTTVNKERVYRHQISIKEAMAHPFIQRHCCIAYTSPSHQEGWDRFRLGFMLPETIHDVDVIEGVLELTMRQIPCDPSCKDACRVFYGNTGTEFFIFNPELTLPKEWQHKALEIIAQREIEAEKRHRERLKWLDSQDPQDTEKDILEALRFIPGRDPGSGNYDECRTVLMALHSHYGDAAVAIAESWSPSISGTTWNIPKKIRSFRRGGVGIGSLFYIAKEHGWRKQRSAQTSYSSLNGSGGTAEPGEQPLRQDDYKILCEQLTALLVIPETLRQEYERRKIAKAFSVSTDFANRLFEHLRRGAEPEEQTSFTLDEFLSLPVEASNWVLPGVLPNADLTFIAAAGGVGKSLLAYELSHAVISGGQALGLNAEQGPVIYYPLEESIITIKKRLVGRGFDALSSEYRGQLLIERAFDANNLEILTEKAKTVRPRLVVLDSYRKINSQIGIDENHPDFAALAYRLQGLAQKHEFTVVIIHHQNKSQTAALADRLSGTGALRGACASIWQMERLKEEDPSDTRRVLSITKQRDGEPTAFEIDLEIGACGQWKWNVTQEIGVPYEVRTGEQMICELLRKSSPFGLNAAEIIQEIQIHKSTAYRCLNRLTMRGIIDLRPSKTDKAWVYAYPSNEEEF
jgi:hypothetical protein